MCSFGCTLFCFIRRYKHEDKEKSSHPTHRTVYAPYSLMGLHGTHKKVPSTPSLSSIGNNDQISSSALDSISSVAQASDADSKMEQLLNATLQYPSSNDEWEYNVYDCYVELTKYTGQAKEALTIPAEIDNLPVWSINTGKIYADRDDDKNNSFLTAVEFPDCLLFIGNSVFENCNITSLNIPNSLYSIGDNAFHQCGNLSSLTLPDGLKTIGESAFETIKFDSVEDPVIVIPASVERIDKWAFNGIYRLTTNPGMHYGYEVVVQNANTQLEDKCFNDATKIHGHAGSTAAQYCAEHDIDFVLIKE